MTTPLELPDGVPHLAGYYAYLTAGCNLACRHCWVAPTYQRDGSTGGHLPFDLFAQALEEGLPLGLKHVKLTGGEPLLHPDFSRMVELLREKGLGLTIETNGTLLTVPVVRQLKERSTLGDISVSLDGASPAAHDGFRGVVGSFEWATAGVRLLVEHGIRPQLIMSLHRGNVEEIEPMVRLAERLGASSVKLNMIHSTGRGARLNSRGDLLDFDELMRLGRWVEQDLQARTKVRLYFSWPMAFWGLRRLLGISGYTCSVHHILGILASGDLALCGIGAEVSQLRFGQLGKDRVAQVWATHPLLRELRRVLPTHLEGICAECLFRDYCLGLCAADNYHRTGRLSGDYWFCRTADEAGVFPTSRTVNGTKRLETACLADRQASRPPGKRQREGRRA